MTTPNSRSLVATSAFTAAFLATAVAAAQDGDGPDVTKLAEFVRWSGVFASVFVIVGAIVGVRFISAAADRLGKAFHHRRLLFQKVESFTRFGTYIVTVILVVTLSFRINDTVLTIIGGTLAVAVGFAMRDVVASVVAGIIIMFDQPFQVGDRVLYAGEYGDITRIGLRSVRMTTLDDNVVTIPNNKILTDVTSCGNYGALDMQVPMDFFVGLDQDIDLAVQIVKEAIVTSRFVYLAKPVVVLVKEVIKDNYVAAELKGKAYVLDTRYEKAFETDVNRRVLRAFRELGVLPPSMLYRAADGVAPRLPPPPPSVKPKAAPKGPAEPPKLDI